MRYIGEILKYTVLLFITIPRGVNMNQSASITPQKRKLIRKKAAVLTRKSFFDEKPKEIRHMTEEMISLSAKFSKLLSGGSNIINEHRLPNEAPHISLSRRFFLCKKPPVDARIR